MSSSDPVIRTEALERVYPGAEPVHALRGIDLEVRRGEFVAIMGSSGSGKSTLMNTLGCLDTPSAGEYWLDGVAVSGLTRDERADLRGQKLGFVFQGYNLLARTTALDNVMLPLLYDRTGRIAKPEARAREMLERVGLGGRLSSEPSQLSGGQQQRVAIARALVNDPALLLADEPTGNLDTRTTIEVMALFQEINREGATIAIVTHEPEVSRYTSRIIELRDGLVIHDAPVADQRDAAQDLAALQGNTGLDAILPDPVSL
ncbi:ABC transporter ATP-binding protein [Rubrivirga sp. S365]|nr:ABC transporter ATP-binding protein [Rubrivirga sp. S365]MDT7858360.1 ABC transporter ATP-binding protein [Rubrivirga sp. S365]